MCPWLKSPLPTEHRCDQGRIKTKLGLMMQRKKGLFFSSLVHSTLTLHAHSDRLRSLHWFWRNQPAFIELYDMNNNNDVPTYYRNNSRLTSSYVASTFNTNCLNFWKVHIKQWRLNQINLTKAYWYCHSYYCASAAYLYCCFSSIRKREFFDRVSEVKAAQQLMLNAYKRQHARRFQPHWGSQLSFDYSQLWEAPLAECATQSRRLEMTRKHSTMTSLYMVSSTADLFTVTGFWVRINVTNCLPSHEETRFLALSSICSMFNDVSSERNPNVLLISSYAFIRFSSSAADCRSWLDTSEFWTFPHFHTWAQVCFVCSFSLGIRFRLRPRRCSALYSPCWIFSVAVCSYTSNLSHANWTVSTTDAIKSVAVFRLTVGSWRLMLVLLRRPRISFQAVAITAVSSLSILRENLSAWFLVSAFCFLSAASSSKTSWMLFHPSTTASTASARSHHRVPGKPLSVSMQRFFSCCQRYVESDRISCSAVSLIIGMNVRNCSRQSNSKFHGIVLR